MLEYVLAALSFGFAAGLKPGPLGVVVIQQTLANGLGSGARASLAPMITDGPIILAAMVLFSQFKDVTPVVATLSLVGGLYLMWLASKILRIQDIRLSERLPRTSSLALAIKVNFLNPSPYLFWFTVGGSYIMLGSAVEATVFVVVAIGTLVVSKILVAAVAAMCRPLLDSRAYLLVMKALAVALAVFGALSVSKAYKLVYA